ncbi:Hypp1461 [Branchiostoma lanceolatum]|uniref:Hypp1461 protein n=1 Tax=Branchiostoma lanceolatum TaxID=7740 RepID=A0A8J9ZI43_BRALA|nr:Hypp1461 [Branchiostoma lanceolatum]
MSSGIMSGGQQQSETDKINRQKSQTADLTHIAHLTATTPNPLYSPREGVISSDGSKKTKYRKISKSLRKTIGLVFDVAFVIMLAYFAAKITTLSGEVSKLSEEMEERNKAMELRVAKLEGQIGAIGIGGDAVVTATGPPEGNGHGPRGTVEPCWPPALSPSSLLKHPETTDRHGSDGEHGNATGPTITTRTEHPPSTPK